MFSNRFYQCAAALELSDIFRIFSFFDEGSLVVAINGFQKKTEKTPKNELEKAEKIKQEYFKEKDDDK